MKRTVLLLLFICAVQYANAQAIGPYHLEQVGNSGFSLHYQNDAFGKTDYYYSQGVQVAVGIPSLKHTFLSVLLPHTKNGTEQLGIALEHDAYTPTSILSDSILYGDRPYAASVMAQFYATSLITQYHGKLSAMLTAGIIGPAAGGEEIQAGIHRNTNNDLPHGWQYQIQNDVILNYTLTYEQNLLNLGNIFFADGLGGIALGTYNDKAFAGIDLQAGLFEHPLFQPQQSNFHIYVQNTGTVQLVGYDASLQGGIFNRSSAYTIEPSSVKRIVFKNTLALNIGLRQFTLSGNYTWISPEFKTGKSHAWGGLQVSYRF